MDETYRKEFYERMYADGRVWKGPQGLLGFLYRSFQRFELHRVPAAVSLLEHKGKILDIGCGDGGLLALAKSRKKFIGYYGTDLAQVAINRAKKNVIYKTGDIRKCYFKRANLDEKLPFTDNFFDAVTCIAVLEHIFDPYFGVKEINRILKNRGEFILEVPNLVWLPRRISVLVGLLPVTAEEDGWDGGHLHYFTSKAVRNLLEGSGFKIKYIGCTGIFSRLLNLWPSLLGGNILVRAIKIRHAK